MSAKTKTIILQNGHIRPDATITDKDPYRYKIVKVTDSVEFNPGDFLLKAQVQELCEHKEWKVTIEQPR